MPFDPDNPPDKVKKLSPKKQRQWVEVFNSCWDKHADDKKCHMMAWGVVKKASRQRQAADRHQAIKRMLGNLPDNVKIHTSKKPISKLRSTTQKKFFKPKGLWYACGSDWMDWAENEYGYGDYVYLVHIKESQILHLKSEKDILAFSEEYGFSDIAFESMGPDKIDWKKVASKYAGIEICPYQWGLRMKLMWYYPWDVASGCVWKSSAMQLEYLGHWDGNEFVPGDNSRIATSFVSLMTSKGIIEEMRLAVKEVELALRCRKTNG